ncbi:MAG TPA: peptidase dimerization domain-containing protein, partial [Blastocatellia bacterium]|nr:peptidase dimerization domain-containing protein [Blastocatellia bacterium]
DRRVYYGIGVTEKTPCWLKLTARGIPGHGSVPRRNSAPSRLVRALGRLEAHESQLKVVPAVARYFRSIASLQADPNLRRAFSDVAAAIKDPALRDLVASNPQNSALLRNTIQPTVINVGSKTNVIAPIATAEIDCRLLPGEKPETFIAEIKGVIDDSSVAVEPILAFGASESPFDTDLQRAISAVIRAEDRDAVFVPTVLAGFTDSHFFRDLGIVSYGFSPFIIQSNDFAGVHGNDERISVAAMKRGTQLLFAIVRNFCSSEP